MLIWLTLTAALAGNEVKNPGGERIPFVKLRSEVWDVVIRKTADTRARIERVKAKCQGIWVNACAAGVDPELRQIALKGVFQDGVALSGDFTYCSTAVLRDLPDDLGRELIRADTESFCQTFLDPDSVQGQRSGNATTGENDLVGRLFGAKDTTSGKLMMKAPPTQQGTQSEVVTEASGERRILSATAPPRPSPTANRPLPMPVPTATPPRSEPVAPRPEPTAPQPEPVAPQPEPTAPQPEPFEAAATTSPRPDSPPPVQTAAVVLPAPEPAPPPPPPKPTGPSEFELEAIETENLERLSDRASEDDGKKKKKKGKKKGDSDEMIGGDEEFDNYIIIDIESLSDE